MGIWTVLEVFVSTKIAPSNVFVTARRASYNAKNNALMYTKSTKCSEKKAYTVYFALTKKLSRPLSDEVSIYHRNEDECSKEPTVRNVGVRLLEQIHIDLSKTIKDVPG